MLKIFKKQKLDYFSNTCPPHKSKFPDGSDIEIFSFKAIKKLENLNKINLIESIFTVLEKIKFLNQKY